MASFKRLNVFILTIFCVDFIVGKICDPNDEVCTKCGAREAYSVFISGVENLIETSDPVSTGLIKANLPTVRYELHNAKLSGMKKCDVVKMDIDLEKAFNFHLNCPELDVNGDYVLLGHINNMYVEGEGKIKVKLDDYLLKFNGIYEINTGKDDKEYVHIKNYFIDVETRGKVSFDFQNLFDGDEEKADEVNKYLNENWKIMDKAFRAPPLYSFMDVFIKNLNEFLAVYPVEQIFPKLVRRH